jgi:hypothetical protein
MSTPLTVIVEEELLAHRRTPGTQKNSWHTEELLAHRRTPGTQKNSWHTFFKLSHQQFKP